MTQSQPRSGYTLPVFACAAALAALQYLREENPVSAVTLDLISPPQTAEIPVEQVAKTGETTALAITRSDPGDNLDLTANTPVWALVELQTNASVESNEQILIVGGEGIGKQINAEGKAAIYRYARQLLQANLARSLFPDEQVRVKIILPEGRQLAQRTSNAAFGVVEGLSLLGTSGISQPLSAPGKLEAFRQELADKARRFDCLVFCVGENGLDLARQMGINPQQLVKTANWLGPLLVEASLQEVSSLLLFGYHGKLIKLAGGIFHTHHHLADGRLEILTAYCAQVGLPTPVLQEVLACETTEAALGYLRNLAIPETAVESVYGEIASAIDTRCQTYIRQHGDRTVQIGSVLFDRNRKIISTSRTGQVLLTKLC